MTPDPLAERDLRRALEPHLPGPLVTGTALEVADAGADRLQVTLPRAAFDMLLGLPDEAGYDEPEPCYEAHVDECTGTELADALVDRITEGLELAKRGDLGSRHKLTTAAAWRIVRLARLLESA